MRNYEPVFDGKPKAHFIPKDALNTTEDRPVIGQVLGGFWYALTGKDRAKAAEIRPDLWAEMKGLLPAKICGHMIPKWLFERLCQQHGINNLGMVVIENGGTIHVVRRPA